MGGVGGGGGGGGEGGGLSFLGPFRLKLDAAWSLCVLCGISVYFRCSNNFPPGMKFIHEWLCTRTIKIFSYL